MLGGAHPREEKEEAKGKGGEERLLHLSPALIVVGKGAGRQTPRGNGNSTWNKAEKIPQNMPLYQSFLTILVSNVQFFYFGGFLKK